MAWILIQLLWIYLIPIFDVDWVVEGPCSRPVHHTSPILASLSQWHEELMNPKELFPKEKFKEKWSPICKSIVTIINKTKACGTHSKGFFLKGKGTQSSWHSKEYMAPIRFNNNNSPNNINKNWYWPTKSWITKPNKDFLFASCNQRFVSPNWNQRQTK